MQLVGLVSANCLLFIDKTPRSLCRQTELYAAWFFLPTYKLQRKFHFCFPRKGISRFSSNFHNVESTFMFLWAIYIFPGWVHLFSCSRIGRPIVEIYKSLTDTWMWKLGLRPSNFYSGHIFSNFRYFFFAVHVPAGAKSLSYYRRCSESLPSLAGAVPKVLTPNSGLHGSHAHVIELQYWTFLISSLQWMLEPPCFPIQS
jgi:hypothetical protein